MNLATTALRDKLNSLIASLPEETDPEWALALTGFVTHGDVDEWALRSLVDDESESSHLRFAAFYCLYKLERRLKNYGQAIRLLEATGAHFEAHPMYAAIRADYWKRLGTDEAMKRSMSTWERLARDWPKNWAFLHGYAESVATAVERGLVLEEARLDSAMCAMESAIELHESYPKLYCTRGRLLAVRGDIELGRQSVSRAIDLEDAHSSDYAIRIGDYQLHLMRIEAMNLFERLKTRTERSEELINKTRVETEQSMEKLRSDGLAQIGFFAAVISLTLASINLANRQSVQESASLIVVLMGMLIAGYGLFFFLMERSGRFRRAALVVALIGALVVAVALKMLGLF